MDENAYFYISSNNSAHRIIRDGLDGLVKDYIIYTALGMEILQSCIRSSIWLVSSIQAQRISG